MLNSVDDTVEVISLKGSNKTSDFTAETSFTLERTLSVEDDGAPKPPVPQPRGRITLERLKTADLSATDENIVTPRTDSSQRLAPPQKEDGESRQSVSLSSRRQSVSGWSLASMNSQSDSRSYREKLRERIQTVKELAGTSVTSTRLKNLKKKSPLVTHFDNILDREENEIEAALEKHEEMRKKWKHAVHASLEAEAAHNFFTKEWEEEKETEDEVRPSSPKDGVEETVDNEQTKLVTKDYLGLAEEWQAVYCYVEPAIDDICLRIHRENQIYYYPSNDPVSLEEKLGPDCIPRYLEDEGLYVGPKPVWSAKSYNKLQQRLVMEGRKHWFGEDGELKTFLPNGSENNSDPLLAPIYRNAEMMSVSEPAVRCSPPPQALYLLELEVTSISWSHHPLFSLEHVAARRVLARYQEYRGRLQAGLGCRLASKLQALRTARDNIKRTGDTDGYKRYKRQVKETRELRLEEGRKDRLAVVNCLKAWLELRTLRGQQGYTVTPVRLQIVELEGCGDNLLFGSTDEWDTEFKSQVAERIEEEEDEYNRKHEEIENQDEEEVVIKKIVKKSSTEILEEVKIKLSESLLQPGEPVVALELGDEQITPEAEISDTRELDRRVAQKRCHLSVRVLYNKREVCHSRPLGLYPHFTSSLNQRFSLQVTDWPQSLALQLVLEGGIGSGKQLTASVFVPVPSENTTLTTSSPLELEFSVPDKLGPYPHAGVGCGRTDSSGAVLYAGGHVGCRLGWGEEGGPPTRPPYLTRSRSGRRMTSSLGNMREWVSRAHLDPNDPANADLFEYFKNESVNEVKKSSSSIKNTNDLPEGDFCTMEEIENNPRLKLLSLRNKVVPEFKDIRNIPMRDREIPDDIFDVYKKRTESPLRAGPEVGETAMEWQREWSRQQLELIKDNILQHCRQTHQHTSLREIVLEDQVPDIGTLGLTFMKWLQPKRPLRPTRKERKKLPALGLVGQEVEVIVNVVRAFEVPVRMDVDPLLENGISLVPVRPFVEVSFQGRKSRTTTAEGANPTWNQDLRIPVQLPSSGLYSVQDSLYCQLYDETVVDLLEDDRQRETNIHQRLERHWLGSLRVPFSSLCDNARIEGTFQLYSPPVLLGYQRESQNRQPGTSPSTCHASSSLRDSTFLTLFITVHPPLHPPEPFKERLPCSEMPYVEQHLEEWQAQVMSQFPHRPVKCLVVDTSAKSVCVTRFFQPLAPPVLEEGEPTTAEMALRFVSKIAIMPGSVLFPGLFDVWLTAQQVLSLLSGDCEDHAVLLCCYLSHLGLKAWLLLGSGIPHGPMALVLTKDSPGTSYTLWDPATGHKFSTQDSFCPLHKVYCLINQDNIWANIQREEVVSRTRFDVTRRADWWPVFNRNVAAPVGSVQPATLESTYLASPTLSTDVGLLQDKLEKLLRDSITRWRPATRTMWNRYVSAKLRKLLPGLEKAAWSNNVSVSSEHLNQLTQTLSSHKMCGFTQNFSFTSTEEIVEAVKATGIHTNESPEVEFALAVYIHPFPCSVLSVWVYVTSLTIRR